MDKLGRQTLGPAEWGLARSLGRKELAGLGRRYIVGRMEAVSSPFLTEFLLQSVYESATNLFQIPRCQCRFPMSSLNAGKCGNQTMEIRRRCSVRESERGGRVSVASGKAGGKREEREEAGSTDKASPPPSLGPASLAFFEWALRALQRHDATGGEAEDEACAALL